MDENLSKLKAQIAKIDDLKGSPKWGPEFQLWNKGTENLVRELFGNEGLELFQQQRTRTTSYIDDSFNVGQYQKELDNRKKILEGLLADLEEHRPAAHTNAKPSENVLKEVWRKEEALRANLLPTSEAEELHKALVSHLEKTLPPDSIPGLRLKKLRSGKPMTWWSTNGYPVDNPWEKFRPFLELLEQYEAEKTIKKRLELEGLFVESRYRDEDQHLLIGERDGTGEKAHLIIDGKSGEIRTEDNRKEPTELAAHIETILTLRNGKKIRSTREAIEVLETSNRSDQSSPRIDIAEYSGTGGAEGYFVTFNVINDGDEGAVEITGELAADDLKESIKFDVVHKLASGQKSRMFNQKYDGTDFQMRLLSNPKIIFRYKSPDGRSFTSGRTIIQDSRADKRYDIHNHIGKYFQS